jgi:hypothetical protein
MLVKVFRSAFGAQRSELGVSACGRVGVGSSFAPHSRASLTRGSEAVVAHLCLRIELFAKSSKCTDTPIRPYAHTPHAHTPI